jgi:hypothetical protein
MHRNIRAIDSIVCEAESQTVIQTYFIWLFKVFRVGGGVCVCVCVHACVWEREKMLN